MKILVTGAAGFIGAAVVRSLLPHGHRVVGLDNLNSYYDPRLKAARLAEAGIDAERAEAETPAVSRLTDRYSFVRMDICHREALERLFDTAHFDAVIHLAGQAGVRYSIRNPYSYVESNVLGFLHILENCRHHPVRHLLYAGSSSVYGMANKVPYAETGNTDEPVSLYAATKKSDELMAHAYSHLYGIRATGLRFFTVYGPWGRPDMAPVKFMDAIIGHRPIRVFNHGNLRRDFTYIDDITEGIMLLLDNPPATPVPHAVYNIGRSEPVRLTDFIRTIEEVTGTRAIMEMVPMQPGDVYETYADTTRIEQAVGYRPHTSIREGIEALHRWYTMHRDIVRACLADPD